MTNDNSLASWKEQAYPLKQLIIKIQGTRHSTKEDMISLLKSVVGRLEQGIEHGQTSDDDFGYVFSLDTNVQESIFDGSAIK